jgi:SAM-dependent methyltransferase
MVGGMPAAGAQPGVTETDFDRYADSYDAELRRGLSLTGEGKEYYSRQRLAWVRKCLSKSGGSVDSVLDFGCGDGSATPDFFEALGARTLTGIDVSARSVRLAQARHGSARAAFGTPTSSPALESFDLAFSNGVFHHISPEQRAAALEYVWTALRPGGAFAFWENNPWNPGTRYVMSRVAFDHDAMPISPPAAKRMLREARFAVHHIDFLFVFPRALRALRRLEAPLARFPVGGQYLVWCTRPPR